MNQLRVGLAPMEGVTDFATRYWFQLIGGMSLTWSPFLRVTDTFPGKFPETFAPELTILKGLLPAPLTLQVMGSRVDDIARAADIIGHLVEFIDLNCGCPSPTVVGSRAGSSLLQHVDQFHEFISSVVRRVGPGRLSVKMRTGYNHGDEFPELISCLQSLPLHHLTVHGRTRPQRYTGRSDWRQISYASEQVSFPVIGSGDVCDRSQLRHCLQVAPKIDSVIIGRGALRNPWVFAHQIKAPVLLAFVAFIVMQDAQMADSSSFIQWVRNRSFSKFGQMTADDWWVEICHLLRNYRTAPKRIYDIQVSSRALSRGKMLWGYLRSSLPGVFMEPQLMRSASLADLIHGLELIGTTNGIDMASVPLSYKPDLDWMYSGEGRGVSK